jgi:hypothetical protein
MAAIGGLIAVEFAVLRIGLCLGSRAPVFFTLFGARFGVAALASALYTFGPQRRTAPTCMT